MRWTDARGLTAQLTVLALLVAVAASLGAPVRATYGARTTADEPQYLLSALSLARDGDLDIADELRGEEWRAFHEAQLPQQTKPLPDGRQVSPHDPLLPLLLAPSMALGGWLGVKLFLSALLGVLAALTAWVAIRRLRIAASVALPVVAVLFVSAPLAVYGTQVYPEVAAALAVMIAVAALTGPLDRRGSWVFAAAVIALPWLAVKYAPVAAALAGVGAWRLWREQRRHVVAGLAITFAAAGVVFAVVHLVVWTGLTAYAAGDHFVGGEFTAVGSRPNYVGRSARLLGLLVDREFGLAAWQPAWLAVIPAGAWILRRRPPHWAALTLPLAAGWLTATFVALTMHGYWFPGRQLVVVLPLAVLLLGAAAQSWRGLRLAVLAAGLLGVWSYAWLLRDGLGGRIRWIIDFAEVGDPWYRVWSPLLPAYRTSPPGTWLLHGLWLALLTGVAVAAWRRRGYEVDSSVTEPDALPDADPDAEPDADPDAEPPSSMVRTLAPSSPPQAAAPSTSRRTAAEARRDTGRDMGGSFDPTRWK